MIEYFQKQLVDLKPVTEESLSQLRTKNFTSGRPIQVGDKILGGMIRTVNDQPSIIIPELSLEFILLHEDELGVLYEIDVESNNMNDEMFLDESCERKAPYLKYISAPVAQ